MARLQKKSIGDISVQELRLAAALGAAPNNENRIKRVKEISRRYRSNIRRYLRNAGFSDRVITENDPRIWRDQYMGTSKGSIAG